MTEKQLSFFDVDAAREYQRKQKEAELDTWLESLIGTAEVKKWRAKNARMKAKLDEIDRMPLSTEMKEAADRIRAKVLAATKPLTDEFALLGIAQGATKREIKNAYRRQARKLHPDAGGDDDAFKRMYAAYRRVLASAKE